jgi:hypothetical protein
MMDIPILEAKGRNGDIELHEDKVTIRRSGVIAAVLGGDKDIPLSQVTSIQYKKPGMFTNGHIQFLGVSGNNAQNTIIFTTKEQPGFEKIKQVIEQKVTEFNKQREADMKQREVDMEEYMTSLKEGKTSIKFIMESGSSQVILKENEELQMVLPKIRLWESRTVTTSTGGYGGPSFRVAKGVYFRVGAFGAQSQSHEELKEVDQGLLTLTNKRLLFTGAKRTSEYNLAKIISIEPYKDGIAVRTSGRSKVQYFIGIDPRPISTEVTINGRKYSEPFSGLMLKYMIEGLIKRQE